MATPFTTTVGSASVGASEISAISGTTSLQSSTTAGNLEVWSDVTSLTAAEVLQVRIVDKVNGGSQNNAWISFPKGVQPTGLIRVWAGFVAEGWDVRFQMVTGSARTIGWSLRQNVGDVNALTAGSSAVTSIQSGLATSSAVASVQSDTDDIQARLPTALDGNGNIKAGVQTIAANAITAAAIATNAIDADSLATDAVTEIQTGLATSSAVASVQTDTTTIVGRVDVATSTRAPESTALSTATWTNTLAALITATLDATISSRASAAQATSIQADTDDIQGRLPSALDGSGNIKAGVQSLVSGAITSIATGVMTSVVETGFTVNAVLQIVGSALAGTLSGLSTNNPVFKSLNGLKNRIVGTTSADGRLTVTFDLS